MVVLRNENNSSGTRYLSAELGANGDLLFQGRDYGKGVKDIFDYSEYEWAWTVKKEHFTKLAELLGNYDELLVLIQQHFSGTKAANIQTFLETHQIPIEVWSRIGD